MPQPLVERVCPHPARTASCQPAGLGPARATAPFRRSEGHVVEGRCLVPGPPAAGAAPGLHVEVEDVEVADDLVTERDRLQVKGMRLVVPHRLSRREVDHQPKIPALVWVAPADEGRRADCQRVHPLNRLKLMSRSEEAAIDGEVSTGDVGGGIRQHEADRLGGLGGPADAPGCLLGACPA
jgi:hypothetical protein